MTDKPVGHDAVSLPQPTAAESIAEMAAQKKRGLLQAGYQPRRICTCGHLEAAHIAENGCQLCRHCEFFLARTEAASLPVDRGAPQPDYKTLVELAARVLLQHMNDEDYEMSLAGLYAALTEHQLNLPSVDRGAPQWLDCPRCHQQVPALHECFNSVLNEGRGAPDEREKGWDDAIEAAAKLIEELKPHWPYTANAIRKLVYRAGAESRVTQEGK